MKKLSLFLPSILLLFLVASCESVEVEQPKAKPEEPADIILSVNAYSFNDLLRAKNERNGEQVYTLFNLLDWCATQNIKALDPTAYFFPTYPEVPSDAYLEKFKNYAANLGIAISGTGVRNNFASPDPAVRAEGVALAKEWIVAANKIGAPVLRVFAGAIPAGYENNCEVPAQWMIECYRELIPLAKQYGVKIGIQNHGEMLQTAEECLYVMRALDSEWVGIIVDTGNFNTENPYKDMAAVLPYAVNWQVKKNLDGVNGTRKTDLVKLAKLIKEGGYKGYLPVETLLVRDQPYDPFALVPAMIQEMREAMKIAQI